MGRLAQLQETLRQVVVQADSSCVVVDYSCPDRCGEWVSANHPHAHVVQVSGQKTFNRSLAGNAGSRAIDAPWVCFFDCDILFDLRFAEQVLPLLQPGNYYCPSPIRDWALCGTFICSREDFNRIGGYDEVYEGWGERDLDVYTALEFIGIKRQTFPSSLLRHLSHSEQSRVRFHHVKARHVAQSTNRIYRFIKFDLMHVVGQFLPRSTREGLYQKISERTKSAIYEGKPLDLAVDVPGRNLILEYQVYGIKTPLLIRWMMRIYGSHFINRLHRFFKASVLRRSMDFTNAIYGRHLPFGRRLELRLTSKVGMSR